MTAYGSPRGAGPRTLDRATELLWQAGHPRIAEQLHAEIEAICRTAVAVLDAARTNGSVSVSLREDLAEAVGLPREYARGKWRDA